jgi:hypothetical protein
MAPTFLIAILKLLDGQSLQPFFHLRGIRTFSLEIGNFCPNSCAGRRKNIIFSSL